MKQVAVTIIILFSALFAVAGEELKVGVKGMVCAFCAQGIEKKFKAEPEIEKVKVSLENKFVLLTFKDGKNLTKEKIKEILKDAGYEANFDEKSPEPIKESDKKPSTEKK
ncbi:MAG: heavy-metal-associated domain-containing protein [Proteobacteria bacterium]|jgi:mercuric ion binding protein|nr:heavy-metal-associated domain-containing protein [Pseudomonadota bacterium]